MSYVSPIKIGYTAEPEEGWTDKIGKYLAGEVDNLVLQSCVKVGCHVDMDELEKALRYDRDQYVKGYEDGKRDAAAAIEALQAETVRLWPKRGKWINSKERMRPDMCSVCGCAYEADRFMYKIVWNYCPNCGAKMEVQE